MKSLLISNTSVIRIGSVKYSGLAEAIDTVTSEAIITIEDDYTLPDKITIDKDVAIKIDLNGKKITASNSIQSSFHLNNGKLIISNGIIECNKEVFHVDGGSLVIEDNAIITSKTESCIFITNGSVITSGTLTSEGLQPTIQGNSLCSGDVTVSGGSITNEKKLALYHPQNGKLLISDGIISGNTGVWVSSGTVTITGGEIHSTGEKTVYSFTPNEYIYTGDALVIEACGYPSGNPTVSIFGGKFTSEYSSSVAYYTYNDNKMINERIISGGEFNTLVPEEYYADGHSFTKTDEGFYEVKVTGKIEEDNAKISCEGFSIKELTTNYMFGIDLVDQQGNPFPDSLIASYLNGAISWAEQLFDICLTKKEVTDEMHDYERSDYMNWGYIQSFCRPIKEVTGLSLMYGAQPSFTIPLEWLKVDKLGGKIQMFPSQGSANNLIISQSGVIFGLQQRWGYCPQMWKLDYVAGMDEKDIPENLKILIYKQATIGIITVWGDLIIGAGIANQSISIDGLSQSIGTTQSEQIFLSLFVLRLKERCPIRNQQVGIGV